MRSFIKSLLLAAAALLAAGAAAVWIAVDRLASAPGLKPRIEAAASRYLGRPLTIDALEWKRWPQATLVGTGVRLYEDPLKKNLLIEAPVVEADLSLLSLRTLAAGVSELKIARPRVYLRRDRDGTWNAARVAAEIAARPDEPAANWGTLAFNWFSIEGGTATVEDARGEYSGLPPLRIDGRGKLKFGRRHLHFPFELAGSPENSATTAELSGDLGGNVKLELLVQNADASLARYAWSGASRWSGRWNGEWRYQERPDQWRVDVRAAPFALSTAGPRLASLEVNVSDAPPAETTFTGVARSSSTEIRVKGAARPGMVDLDVSSPRADLPELIAWAQAAAGAAAAAPSAPPTRFAAKIVLDDLRYGETAIRDLRAAVSRSSGPYALDSLTFDSLGGSVSARGSYRPSDPASGLELSWKTAGVSARDLFRLAGSTKDVDGSVDSAGELRTGVGGRFLSGMNGALALDVKRGWLGDAPGLLKALSRVNIATLLTQVSGRGGRRVPFDEAKGTVKIERGRLSAEKPFVLENKTMQLAFMGSYDLPTRTVDGRIVVNFLTVTDEIIGLIPGVRDILLGREKGLMPIWLEVKGKGDDPDVEVLPARTISGPVWNTFRHLLRLPQAVLDKLKPSSPSPAPPAAESPIPR